MFSEKNNFSPFWRKFSESQHRWKIFFFWKHDFWAFQKKIIFHFSVTPMGHPWPPWATPWPLMGHTHTIHDSPPVVSAEIRGLGPHKPSFSTLTILIRHPWPLMGLPWPLMGPPSWPSVSHIQLIQVRQQMLMVEIPPHKTTIWSFFTNAQHMISDS